ncbi:hypothetical protein TNCV_5031381 [Trichonephila clavipes]|nr:hypothetical protein TNCV_5031381 [Trichonephila clavipes]
MKILIENWVAGIERLRSTSSSKNYCPVLQLEWSDPVNHSGLQTLSTQGTIRTLRYFWKAPTTIPGTITVAEWSRYWIVAGLFTSSSPVPLKTRLVGQRCTLNLSRAEAFSR